MKFYVDEELVFELSDTQKKVIMNDINSDEFVDDMKRRVKWVIENKLENCQERLHKEWLPLLSKSLDSLPTNKDAISEIIFLQSEYYDRKSRDLKSTINN